MVFIISSINNVFFFIGCGRPPRVTPPNTGVWEALKGPPLRGIAVVLLYTYVVYCINA